MLFLAGFGVFNISRNKMPVVKMPPAVKRPDPNGFDLYMAAGKAIFWPQTPIDPINDPVLKTPAEAASAYSLPNRKAWLQKNVRSFALFNRAMHTPTMYPNPRELTTSAFSHAGTIRSMSRCKIAQANTFKLMNQPDKAVASSLDCIQMGIDISNGADITWMIIGGAAIDIGLLFFRQSDSIIEQLSSNEANAAAQRLEALIERKPTFLSAIKEERWCEITKFVSDFKKPDGNWRESLLYPLEDETEEKPLT